MKTKLFPKAPLAILISSMLIMSCSSDDDNGTTTAPEPEAPGDPGDPANPGDPGAGVAQFSVLADNDTVAANGINGLAYASDGRLFAVGPKNSDVAESEDTSTTILAFNADGSPDTSFGTGGALTLNIKTAGEAGDSGSETAYGVAVLEDDDLVVLVNAGDGNGADPVNEGQSVYLLRLDADSDYSVVTGFGDDGGSNGLLAGVQEVVFGWSNDTNGTFPSSAAESFPRDTSFDLDVDNTGDVEKLVIAGSGTAASGQLSGGQQATDNDRYVVRVLASDGTVDNDFNGGSAFSFSTPRGESSGDNGRRAIVEEDGSIMSAGYTNLGEGQANHLVLIRLLPDGSLDTSFGNFIYPEAGSVAGVAQPGVAVFNPFRESGGFSEGYAAGKQSTGGYVTTGYGRANGGEAPEEGPLSIYEDTDSPDIVSFRVSGGTALDVTYGVPDAPGTQAVQSEGVSALTDAEEISTEERGRDLAVLADDRTVQVGYFGGLPAAVVLTADGQLDTTVDDDGIILLPHTSLVNTSEAVTQQFFTAKLSADGSQLALGTRSDEAGARVVIINTAE